MAGITSLGNLLSQQFMLRSLRDQVDDTQRQITTGKTSSSIAGLGADGASQAISFRNKTNLLDTYTNNINGQKAKLTVMDAAIGSVASTARDMLATLRSQLQQTTPQATIISDEAKTSIADIQAKLNEQVNGQYVFSGDDLNNAPFNNATTLNANFSALVGTWLTGTTPATVVANSQAQTGLNLGYSSTLLTSGPVSFKADDNTNIDITQLANQPGFADVMRGMAIISNLPQPTTALEQTNYWNIVNGAISLLDSGAQALDTAQGLLGNKTKLANNLLQEHSDTKANFEIYTGNVEDVDMATASTKFQALQNQMQLSYSVISMLKDLNLVNFL